MGSEMCIRDSTDSIYLNLGDLVDRVYEGREKDAASIVSFLNKAVSYTHLTLPTR